MEPDVEQRPRILDRSRARPGDQGDHQFGESSVVRCHPVPQHAHLRETGRDLFERSRARMLGDDL